jgi:hypothetical protein
MERPRWKDSLPDARTVSVPTGQASARIADGPMVVGEPGPGRKLPGWRRASHPDSMPTLTMTQKIAYGLRKGS